MNGEHGVNQTLNNRTRTLALAVLCAGIFLAAVDQTVVVTVLPSIIDDLEGGFSSAAVERAGWIVSSYLFGYTVVLPLMGRVADRFGHRRTYIISADLLVTGFGFGMVIAPISLFAVNAVKKSMMASGFGRADRQPANRHDGGSGRHQQLGHQRIPFFD